MTQGQLKATLFPVGDLTKQEVRQIAGELGLPVASKPESQEICFIPDNDYTEFIREYILQAALPGPIFDEGGHNLGSHRGIRHYTIGQRRGLGIPDATPYYVVALNAAANEVVIGKDDDLWQRRLAVSDINWLSNQAPALPAEFTVKIRYRHQGARAMVRAAANGLLIEFVEAQRAVTPGQFAVLYQDDEVIGSGRILGADE